MKVQRGGFVEGWTEPVVAAEWRSPRRFQKSLYQHPTTALLLEVLNDPEECHMMHLVEHSTLLKYWVSKSFELLFHLKVCLWVFDLFLSFSLYIEIYATCDWTSSRLWAPSLLRRYRSAGGEPGRAPCHTNERLCPTGQSASRKILKVLALNPLVCVFLFFEIDTKDAESLVSLSRFLEEKTYSVLYIIHTCHIYNRLRRFLTCS